MPAASSQDTQGTGSFGFFLALAVLFLLPLALNRGYFSHDEMQWLGLADVDSWRQVPWPAWLDIDTFQYRPLTFNLWLTLAHAFGYVPVAMHSVLALLGLVNAGLLRACALRLGASARAATFGALVFLLSPYVVYTHAWVAALADVLCLMFLLLGVLWLCRPAPAATTPAAKALDALPVIVLTALALLSKESAIVIPALLWVAWPLRRERMWWPFVGSACVVALYLALRADIILFAPRSPGIYTWSLWNIPRRLADYALFPFYLPHFEVIALKVTGWNQLWMWLCAACVVMLLGALASAGRMRLLLFVLGWIACLGPVLILDSSSNVYAYLASAFACGWFAVHFRGMPRGSRCLLILPLALALAHGFKIGQRMHHIGDMQKHLYADLVRLLPSASAADPLRIRSQRPGDDYVVRRLLLPPTYRRMPLAARAVAIPWLTGTQPPNYLMHPSGRLEPVAADPDAKAQTPVAR